MGPDVPPRRVKLNKDVLVRVGDDLLKVLADHCGDTSAVVFRDGRRLDVRLQLASLKISHKSLACCQADEGDRGWVRRESERER